MSLSREESLFDFFTRLRDLPAASGPGEALEQVSIVLNTVEDEHSGVPYDPDSWADDGRLYPPQSDSVRPVPGRADVMRYRTRGHNLLLMSNGAIQIRTISGAIVFSKAGSDGNEVEL